MLCPELDHKDAASIYSSHGLGSVSIRSEKQVKSAVKKCCKNKTASVSSRAVYSTNILLSATNRDVLPALQKSNVIYQF